MKIYVGNLPFSATEEQLKEAFSKFGEVSEVSIIKDKFSGRSKGFAFVTIEDDAAAKKAIKELNEKDFEGRQIKVNEAKPFDPDSKPKRNFGNRPRFSGNRQRRF